MTTHITTSGDLDQAIKYLELNTVSPDPHTYFDRIGDVMAYLDERLGVAESLIGAELKSLANDGASLTPGQMRAVRICADKARQIGELRQLLADEGGGSDQVVKTDSDAISSSNQDFGPRAPEPPPAISRDNGGPVVHQAVDPESPTSSSSDDEGYVLANQVKTNRTLFGRMVSLLVILLMVGGLYMAIFGS